jgi:ATP-binding cassette subfamily F protein 3
LVVSHDRYFLNKVANKIYDMSKDGVFQYLGNYDYYLQKKAELEEEDDEIIVSKTKTQLNAEKKKERENIKDRQQREKILRNLEEEIEMHENKISELELALCQPSTYSDKVLIIELNENLNTYKNNLEILYTQWTEILEK